MKLIIGRQLRIVDPTPEVVEMCETNLIIPNPEYAKKKRMGFWTGNTPQKLHLYSVDGNDLILPYGCYHALPVDVLLEAEEISEFKTPVQFSYNAKPLHLYDYQTCAVQEMYNAGYGILQAPAGSGKTQMGIALAIKWGYRCLWLCHTKDLVKQSKTRAEQFIDPKLLGMITEGKVDIGLAMTFATVQTMANLNLEEYRDLWDVIIVDECHRVSGSPTSVTMYQKVLSSLAAPHKYGLSATVHRADGLIKATYCLLGNIKYEVPEEAVQDRIMKVTIRPVFTGVKTSMECLNTDGTLNYNSMISYLTHDDDRNQMIVRQLMIDYSYGHSCLVLSHRVEHLKKLYDRLPPQTQKNAAVIDGKMTSKKAKAEREKALDDMRDGSKQILFATYSLAKEGLDIPRLDRLFLTTPHKDYAIVTQSMGRIDRKAPGKTSAECYDYVDDIAYLQKCYRKRLTIYRKNGCILL